MAVSSMKTNAMATNYFTLILMLVLTVSLTSCRHDHPVAYQSAIATCDSLARIHWATQPRYIFPMDCIIGAAMPDSLGLTLSGKRVDQDYFKQKITLLNFWFESCPPCVEEIPELNKLIANFGEEKFNYLGIGRETDADVLLFLEKHSWRFEQLSNGKYWIESVFKPMWGYPRTMVVDHRGRIVSVWGGINEANYNAFVEQLDSLQRAM
jgi:cytochrome c biogenesis protein CcmG/thiol:disulfide interchange protein DsbE